MIIKLLDRNKNDKIEVGTKCDDCGDVLDYERFVYELKFKSHEKDIILCVRCTSILKSEI